MLDADGAADFAVCLIFIKIVIVDAFILTDTTSYQDGGWMLGIGIIDITCYDTVAVLLESDDDGGATIKLGIESLKGQIE